MDTFILKKQVMLSIIIMAICCVSCKTTSNKICTDYILPTDTIVTNALSDSILDIIWQAHYINCTLQNKNPNDSHRIDTIRVIPQKRFYTLKYLLSDTQNFKSNDIVFGLFTSTCKYQFQSSRRKTVSIEFDFGLKKWRILDNKNKEIFCSDMKENATHFFRFTQLLFPNDLTLKILNNN